MILGNKCDMEDKRVVSKDRGEAVSYYCLKKEKICTQVHLNVHI